jgi:kynureninase
MHVNSRDYARSLDELDPLREFRARFVFDDPQLIYLDGNSLGMLPRQTPGRLEKVITEEWGRGLIRSWNTGWYDCSREVAAKIAPLIGAKPHEVIVADSTSVNLFKLACAALKKQAGRKGIVSDDLNFPSDIYILQGLVDLMGNEHELRLAKSINKISVYMSELKEVLGDDTALLSLSYVVFKSSFMYDMEAVTRLAQQKGAMVLWDLSHAVGAVPVDLNGCNVDLAIGCTYKYLNGGPGSPAFLYVREDLQQTLQSPVWGWFGQNRPFDFDLQYQPANGIERFLAGTPPLLSLSALEPGLDLLNDAGMDQIRHKSILQSEYLIGLFDQYLKPLGYTLGSPSKSSERGSHVSLKHPEAYRICKALIDPSCGNKTIIPDFREPDNIRLGIAPLYIRYVDIFDTVQEFGAIISDQLYLRYSLQREKVT